MSDSTVDNAGMKNRAGTSKLAILASFVAGAFAAWIFISLNHADNMEDATASAPATSIGR